MTHYDHLLPLSREIIKGLAGKPGVHFADKEMAANWLAQKLAGILPNPSFCGQENRLAACAPDLLAALKGIIGITKAAAMEHGYGPTNQERIKRAEAAIAKAEQAGG